MDHSFVCPTCLAVHGEPADAAFTLQAVCLDCDLEARYLDALELLRTAIPFRAAA